MEKLDLLLEYVEPTTTSADVHTEGFICSSDVGPLSSSSLWVEETNAVEHESLEEQLWLN